MISWQDEAFKAPKLARRRGVRRLRLHGMEQARGHVRLRRAEYSSRLVALRCADVERTKYNLHAGRHLVSDEKDDKSRVFWKLPFTDVCVLLCRCEVMRLVLGKYS